MKERLELASIVAWAVLTAPIGYLRDEIVFRRIGRTAINE